MEKNVSKFDKDFIKSYDEDSDEGYILEAKIEYPKDLQDLDSDLPFFHETTKIDKCHKLVCKLYDKSNCIVHISSLKQTLDHGLILKKVHKEIQFDQKATLKLINDSAFRKTTENVRKYREIRLVTTNKRRNNLVSEPNYHTTKMFLGDLLAIEMKKIKVKMNKPADLGLSIL